MNEEDVVNWRIARSENARNRKMRSRRSDEKYRHSGEVRRIQMKENTRRGGEREMEPATLEGSRWGRNRSAVTAA